MSVSDVWNITNYNDRITEIKKLALNWDGEGAKPFSDETINNTQRLSNLIRDTFGVNHLFVIPVHEHDTGSIDIEVTYNNVEICFNVKEDKIKFHLYIDRATTIELKALSDFKDSLDAMLDKVGESK